MGFRRSKLIFGAAVLCVLLCLLGTFGWRAERHRRDEAEARQAASRRADVASLLELSAVGAFSGEEQARLDRAGTNPGDVQRALVEIHELRLAFARSELQEAQDRRAGLAGTARPAAPERVQVARRQEQTAAAEVARYADALSNLQSWRPGSRRESVGSVGGTQAASATAASGPASREDGLGAASGAGSAAGSGAEEDVALEGLPVPAAAEVANAAKHPTITVYPDGVAEAPASAGAGAVGAGVPSAKAQEEAVEVGRRGVATAADQARDQAEIRATLQRWAHAMMLNDPRAETAEYSPHLERYFLYRNVDRSFVQADKAAYLRRGNITARFTIENVHFDKETPDSADLSLVKDVAWSRSPNGPTRKLIRSRLHLLRTEQGWKIAGEQDLR